MKVAAVLEAEMNPEQTQELTRLMEDGVAHRPSDVALATLLVEGSRVRMIAYWNSAEALDAYRAESPVLRGQELMRKVGVEPTVSFVDVPAFA